MAVLQFSNSFAKIRRKIGKRKNIYVKICQDYCKAIGNGCGKGTESRWGSGCSAACKCKGFSDFDAFLRVFFASDELRDVRSLKSRSFSYCMGMRRLQSCVCRSTSEKGQQKRAFRPKTACFFGSPFVENLKILHVVSAYTPRCIGQDTLLNSPTRRAEGRFAPRRNKNVVKIFPNV